MHMRMCITYDLFGGACRTAGGNKGSYDERWDLTPNQCRQRCDERAADCVAFELMMVGSFELCKLHKDPITNVMKVAGASCSVKARSHALVPFLIAAFSALSHPCGLCLAGGTPVEPKDPALEERRPHRHRHHATAAAVSAARQPCRPCTLRCDVRQCRHPRQAACHLL